MDLDIKKDLTSNWFKLLQDAFCNDICELEKKIVTDFGSVDQFKNEFKQAGITQFGSGWCWLVKDKDGSLKVTKTENGVNPVCFGQTALLGCDVWEHSYYIDFRNKRPVYLKNFVDNLVNWENVASRL